MIRFDHMRLVNRQPTEMSRFRSWVLSAAPGEFAEVIVTHEHDGRCCRQEPWNETASKIIEALNPPVAQVLLNLNAPETRATR